MFLPIRARCSAGPAGFLNPTGHRRRGRSRAAARRHRGTTNNVWGDANQQRLVKELLATGKPVIVVALGGPYDIAYFDQAPSFLAAHGYQPNSLTAIADTLLAPTQPDGCR